MAHNCLSNLKTTLDNYIAELNRIHCMFCKNPERNFTRNRKISFHEYIQLMLLMQSKSVSNEILDRLLACDGSDVNIARDSSDERTFIHLDPINNKLDIPSLRADLIIELVKESTEMIQQAKRKFKKAHLDNPRSGFYKKFLEVVAEGKR